MPTITDAYEECRRLNKYYGTPFFHAMNSFPKPLQPHIHSLYAFDRIVHEMLHNPNDGVSRSAQLQAVQNWQKAFEEGINSSEASNIYLKAVIHTTKIFDIPVKHFVKFSQAKIADHKRSYYSSYAQLQKHIDQTLGRTTEMSGIILGVKNMRAKKALVHLARASFLTNMLSKLGKDYERKNRCLLPKKDMKKFGYTMADLKDHIINDEWRYLMEYYMKKIQSNLDYMEKNIHSFPSTSQLAMENTVQIYNSLIESIRRKDYDVFSYQPRLSPALKLRHMLPALSSLLH